VGGGQGRLHGDVVCVGRLRGLVVAHENLGLRGCCKHRRALCRRQPEGVSVIAALHRGLLLLNLKAWASLRYRWLSHENARLMLVEVRARLLLL